MPSTVMKRYALLAGGLLILIAAFTYTYNPSFEVPSSFHDSFGSGSSQDSKLDKPSQSSPQSTLTLDQVIAETQPYIDNAVPDSGFGEMGKRTETLIKLLQELESGKTWANQEDHKQAYLQVEKATLSLYPFLKNPSKPDDPNPLATLRKSYIPGSRGIVIPAGKGQFRFAMHLIGNIRDALGSWIDIQVAYAGDEDLPKEYRDALTSTWGGVETVNVLDYFDDTTLKLREGGWAIKPFAMLASKFEHVMLADADAVLVQRAEGIFDSHSGWKETGTLLFHDRLLWQNVFRDRAKWWKQEMGDREPSETLKHSKVWMEGYAEEGDSGVMLFDKSRIPVLMAMLHIAWQNSDGPRNKFTYKITYGDKESYWFGLELCRVPFTMEAHYGAVIGQTKTVNNEEKVCGFVIAHVDEADRLLWYNGSLLKNKAVNKKEYWVPDSWMIDAEWQKGATKPDMSCMRGGQVRAVPPDALKVVHDSVAKAKEIDEKFAHLIGSLD